MTIINEEDNNDQNQIVDPLRYQLFSNILALENLNPDSSVS